MNLSQSEPFPTPAAVPRPAPILDVTDLKVAFESGSGRTEVVRGLSYSIDAGKTLGIVGESGCGKTIASLALLDLVPTGGQSSGSILLDQKELVGASAREWRHLRGNQIAMVFQEPMTALNPVMKIGRQIAEVLVHHKSMTWRMAQREAVELLDDVGIASPAQRAEDYPHQLSGGMRQRAMIAMALACRPKILIADEPTTALDVTIQAQILDLMLRLQQEIGMAIQFISHNLAVVSGIADDIMVMYAGKAVECASAGDLFARPLHPYTQGLIATLPSLETRVEQLPTIPGSVARISRSGCRFAARCAYADDGCRQTEPPLVELVPGHKVACFKAKP